MRRKELLKRLRKVEGTPPVKKVGPIKVMRRDYNYVELLEDTSEEYDDFFDYEQDILADDEDFGPSARELAEQAPGAESFFEMSESDKEVSSENSEGSGLGLIVMETVVEKEEPVGFTIFLEETEEESVDEPEYKKVVGFEFIQCDYIKKDGAQCKRQAPKNETICSIHKRMLAKRNA